MTCWLSNQLLSIESSLSPLEAWGAVALSIKYRICRHPRHKHYTVNHINSSTTSLLPHLITALIYLYEHNHLQWSLWSRSVLVHGYLWTVLSTKLSFWRRIISRQTSCPCPTATQFSQNSFPNDLPILRSVQVHCSPTRKTCDLMELVLT